MVMIVGVRFPASSKVYYFSPGAFAICSGDGVIVETIHGQEYGVVCEGPQEVATSALVTPLKEVLRMATQQDMDMRDQGAEKIQEAKTIAAEKIAEHGLDMKLVDVDFSFDGNKITFYFTADGRVDFRSLVKDLAGIFRTRIELRQIGVRDEARMVGGLGCCGREVCCRKFLKDFHPVSIKMAKEQSLSLNPTKISGICGRLMCCLQYEQATYEALRKEMPRIGTELYTPEGKGVVIATQVIAERVRVRVQQEDSYEIFDFKVSEISTEGPVPRRSPEPLPELELAEDWGGMTLSEELGGPSAKERERSKRERSNRERNERERNERSDRRSRNRGRNDQQSARRNDRGGSQEGEGGERPARSAQSDRPARQAPTTRPDRQGERRAQDGEARGDQPRRRRRGGRGRGGQSGEGGQQNGQGQQKPRGESRPQGESHSQSEGRSQGEGRPQNESRPQNVSRPQSESHPQSEGRPASQGSGPSGDGQRPPSSRNRNRRRRRPSGGDRPGGGAGPSGNDRPSSTPGGEG